MTLPLISVVIPLYNKVAYIERTLAVVCAQTYRNLEIIVSDNGSCDGSTKLVRKFRGSRPITHLRLNNTLSQNESWRYALQLSTGDLVNLHGADDYTLAPDWLERMSAPLLANPAFEFSVCETRIVSSMSLAASALVTKQQAAIAQYSRDVVATPDRTERGCKLWASCLENLVGSPYVALVRREALPWAYWQRTRSYCPEAYADWEFMFRLFRDHAGVWVEDTQLDQHLDRESGFSKIVSRTSHSLMVQDAMTRLLMPITMLTAPEYADLRHTAGEGDIEVLFRETAHRLEAAMNLADKPNPS